MLVSKVSFAVRRYFFLVAAATLLREKLLSRELLAIDRDERRSRCKFSALFTILLCLLDEFSFKDCFLVDGRLPFDDGLSYSSSFNCSFTRFVASLSFS